MVHPLGDYMDDPTRFTRSYAATKDRSWEGNEVEFDSVVEKVGAIDQRVAAQLALLLAFGLRRKEAIMFMPHVAVVCRDDIPSQHPSDRYAVFLRIECGPKTAACALGPFVTMSSAERSNELCHSRRTRSHIWDTRVSRLSNPSSVSTT
jgi:hypothetical protein